jgi:hypothetical protein
MLSAYNSSSLTSIPTYEIKNIFVRFQVFTVASMKMLLLWDIEPCSLAEVDMTFQRFVLPLSSGQTA